jgi:hypothetical protein
MTSLRKIEANRHNATLSTGPRTAAGKAASALNGMRHGPLSHAALLPGEDEGDLVAFGRKIRASLAPVGEMEVFLADRVVTAGWRLRRLLVMEAVIIGKPGVGTGTTFDHSGGRRMLALSRYEASVERGFYKALHELQRMQAARRGEAVPLPEMLDATFSMEGTDEPEDTEDAGFGPPYMAVETDTDPTPPFDPENPSETRLSSGQVNP